MTARVLRYAAVVTVGLCLALLREAIAVESVELTIAARLGFAVPEIEGSVAIRWRNPGPEPARSIELLLFANRFRSIDGMDDLARHFLVAGGSYRGGGTDILSVDEGGSALAWAYEDVAAMPAATIARVDLGRELGAGEETQVRVQFRTRLPNLLDTLGATSDLLIAAEGWYPQPAEQGSHCPRRAHARVQLIIPPGSHLLLDGKYFNGEAPIADTTDLPVSLVLSREPFVERSLRVGSRTARLYSAPSAEFAHRISRNEDALDALFDTLPAILAESGASEDLTVVLGGHDPLHVEGAGLDHDTHHGEDHRQLVGDELAGGPQAPHQRVLVG